MERYLKALNQLDMKLSSINYAMSLTSFDAMTAAPKNSVEARATALEGLSTFYFETLVNEDVKNLLNHLNDHSEALTPTDCSKMKILMQDYEQISKIPSEEYAAFEALKARASVAWEEAKEKNDFSIFAPKLEQVINTTKQFIAYRGIGGHPYNTLLDDYEKGLTTEKADAFFDYLRAEIVPLVKAISESDVKIEDDFIKASYPIEEQKAFSKFLMEKVGFRMDSGLLAESVHPFTINLSREDVRITTRYMENDMVSTMASTIHESGHAIYEQNVDSAFGLSIIATGTSMGIHESQSRLFENNFGRSKAFWDYFYEPMQGFFKGKLDHVAKEDFYKALNTSKPSLIRVDADELTYPLHIMVRYEIEKAIIASDIDVYELPKLWNDKYEAYLGIRPKDDGEGILQDVHWSEGLFGYFPSYALGSAYSVQFEKAMKKEVDVDGALSSGDFKPILKWLEKNIHVFGRTKDPDDIIMDATGEAFNPEFYVNYLKEKYRKVYAL